MCSQVSAMLVFGLLLGVLHTGLSLQCWKCTSDYDATCRDFFNTTRILQNQRNFDNYGSLQPVRTEPHLAACEGMHTSTIGQYKNVCLKKVITGTNGLKQVTRECRMVQRDLKIGACPDDITYASNSKSLEYCGTCEYDGCNTATRRDIVFAGLVPAVILLLRKYNI